jgi:protein MpaA
VKRPIGHSVEGRAIACEQHGIPSLLVFGGIHGDEPGSVELCMRYARNGCPEGVAIINALNPDGLIAKRKNNAHNVDLNRNFGARNWRADHLANYFPGDAPESEPETQALVRIIDELRPRVIVSVHQPFACVNWDGPSEALARAMSAECGYPAVASVGYPTPGSFGSRYGVDLALPVITLELPRPVPDGDWAGCLRALECARLFSAAGPPT